MKFPSLPIFALLTVGTLALPGVLEERADCSKIVPSCKNGYIEGQTGCLCPGQKAPCDSWVCRIDSMNADHMACGQDGTGCAYIYPPVNGY
ncbi:hypothetical protein F4778DRAFT_446070 [Xylariomycetidae sp. FL2044]|nr:hypothetical protein F4778DRAFT_446070 [Xylariomycetidae sp. FL2044]